MPSDEASAAALVVRAGAGDGAAEAELCRRFTPAVRAFARRRLRARDAVDEFCQDVLLTFIAALRRSGVADPERVGGFILGICRNLARERAQAAQRRAELWKEFAPAFAALAEDQPESRPYEVALLEDCLTQLTARSVEVVRFAFVEGESNVQIAERLAMSQGNVRVVRHRALEALRTCVSQRVSWEAA